MKSVQKDAQLVVGSPDSVGRVVVNARRLYSPVREGGLHQFSVRLKRDPYALFVGLLGSLLDGSELDPVGDDGPVRVVRSGDSCSLEITSGVKLGGDTLFSTIAFEVGESGRLRVSGWGRSASDIRVAARAAEVEGSNVVELGEFVFLGEFSVGVVRAALLGS